jgi:hypothetical protein
MSPDCEAAASTAPEAKRPAASRGAGTAGCSAGAIEPPEKKAAKAASFSAVFLVQASAAS